MSKSEKLRPIDQNLDIPIDKNCEAKGRFSEFDCNIISQALQNSISSNSKSYDKYIQTEKASEMSSRLPMKISHTCCSESSKPFTLSTSSINEKSMFTIISQFLERSSSSKDRTSLDHNVKVKCYERKVLDNYLNSSNPSFFSQTNFGLSPMKLDSITSEKCSKGVKGIYPAIDKKSENNLQLKSSSVLQRGMNELREKKKEDQVEVNDSMKKTIDERFNKKKDLHKKDLELNWQKEDMLLLDMHPEGSAVAAASVKDEQTNVEITREMSKKRKEAIRSQINEAKKHLKMFGEWVRKSWIVDEEEKSMWDEAESKINEKMQLEIEDLETIEELKNKLKDADELKVSIEDRENIKKAIEKNVEKQKRLQDAQRTYEQREIEKIKRFYPILEENKISDLKAKIETRNSTENEEGNTEIKEGQDNFSMNRKDSFAREANNAYDDVAENFEPHFQQHCFASIDTASEAQKDFAEISHIENKCYFHPTIAVSPAEVEYYDRGKEISKLVFRNRYYPEHSSFSIEFRLPRNTTKSNLCAQKLQMNKYSSTLISSLHKPFCFYQARDQHKVSEDFRNELVLEKRLESNSFPSNDYKCLCCKSDMKRLYFDYMIDYLQFPANDIEKEDKENPENVIDTDGVNSICSTFLERVIIDDLEQIYMLDEMPSCLKKRSKRVQNLMNMKYFVEMQKEEISDIISILPFGNSNLHSTSKAFKKDYLQVIAFKRSQIRSIVSSSFKEVFKKRFVKKYEYKMLL
ncbi:uncharacterized protein MONOS_13506 [Monocercomonoides exilis]|uniref:uncharacterized protein n=1 Tax=Monocercomonoides exilis TaxID=2049356 RepID=UPI003559DC13|nr:hypothetical protein MONOS_13506 [Monocercomonoides exilis]|eukprot:MONOS_13506.1-p1 / transcript=MONOS_13506.1 / gene=MONOS_13506 / organism=Monocercomonoides_exilis_PA203 / gene_product=unspecified product / transcript_product=unspecified product / location=Mono_scaffold00837:24045-26383(+) / protein_length=748 / sequence_SO=supercontig / SO=protein_coding / is_pseudo=false